MVIFDKFCLLYQFVFKLLINMSEDVKDAGCRTIALILYGPILAY
jgi:hypothetical protein